MKIAPTPAGECLAWRDPAFRPWLFGYEVLRDVEAHWPNEVGKWNVEGRWGKREFSANLWMVEGGLRIPCLVAFFFLAQVTCAVL